MAEKKLILIMDDSTISLQQAHDILIDDYRLMLCKSGKQGMEYLNGNEEKPDLILLDVLMPVKDGYDVMTQIMSNDNLCKIPVVFISSDIDIAYEIKGFKMGAMDFIRKPFNPEIMLSRINRVLEVAKLRKKLEGQVENKTKELEELSEYTNRIQIIARTDGLTGIHNRAYFEDLAYKYICNMKSGCMFMIDIDNFKSVNDTYGHIIGDEVLKVFAETVLKNIENKGIFGRFGGDEFVAIIGDNCDRNDAKKIAQSILDSVSKLEFGFSNRLQLGASIGISVYPDDGNDFMQLYKTSDKALYYVKQNGKMNYHFYSEESKSNKETISVQADLDAIKMIIGERNDNSGAYLVEYDGFKKIYQFLERVVERTKENFQIMLFTLTREDGTVPDSDKLERGMNKMKEVIAKYLRKGDVATTFSSCQYIVILTGANEEETSNVAKRILDVFNKQMIYEDLIVTFDNKEIEADIEAE